MSAKKKVRDTIIVFPSDEHCGSATGLMPDAPWKLATGGLFHPDAGLQTIWQQWVDGWDLVKQLKGRRGRLIVVNNGDAVDGDHHETIELITPDVSEQERIHIECMDYALRRVGFSKKNNDALFYVAGTEVHVRAGGMSEENIARHFADYIEPEVPPSLPGGSDGRYLRWHLRANIGGKVPIDVAHHGGAASNNPWSEENPLRTRLNQVYYRCLEHDVTIPRILVRAHNHRYIHAELDRPKGRIDGFVTPSFQLKTHFGQKVANLHLTTIGMLIVHIRADGEIKHYCPRMTYQATPMIEV
jgi:hypothetical protein